MSRIAAVAPVLPDYSYTQAEITAELAPLISAAPGKRAVLERMHAASGIGRRHTALPLERYRELGTFRESNDLQGASVDLVVGQVLNINTGDLAVDSYTAEVADGAILEFVQGREDGSAVYNPGFTAKAVGETEVTMTNEQGGIQPLEFTVTVTE